MVAYTVNIRESRIGYVQSKKLWGKEFQSFESGDKLGLRPVVIKENTFLTDDPIVSQREVSTITKGTTVVLLGEYNPYYAYVQTTIEGKEARGFIPMSAIGVPDDKESETPPEMEGYWIMDAGGTMYATGAFYLSKDGTAKAYDYESGSNYDFENARSYKESTWKIEDYDPDYQLFYNTPEKMITFTNKDGTVECYGLTFEPDENYLSMTYFEGGGGYRRMGTDPS